MATGVFFHAHPDDEAIATGGTMAKAKRDGHRVVLVVATNGEEGEPVEGVLAPGEALGDRRRREVAEAADLLGIDRVVMLDYRDSGMMGDGANDNPACFWQADVDEAAERLATVLREEAADLLVVYDEKGVYGHPDHIQVYRVGVRAAELCPDVRVFECSPSRDHMRKLFEEFARLRGGEDEESESLDIDTFGLPEALLTHRVDVDDFAEVKKAALLCHASQVSPDNGLVQMPDEAFRAWAGVEWYRRYGSYRGEGAAFERDIFEAPR